MSENHAPDDVDEVGIEGAARIARRHVSTMRRYLAAGEGPPVYRRGRRLVYRRSEVEAWAARHDALVPAGGGPRP
ncbi:helix-turn-helix domain-containing protein [Kineococcus arenarius]|uniref:helix-turn-helix domain-containing protein n=1 Tax=unclassified Kineococcus TaxID=2621656 RepID=UPI003D7E60D6